MAMVVKNNKPALQTVNTLGKKQQGISFKSAKGFFRDENQQCC